MTEAAQGREIPRMEIPHPAETPDPEPEPLPSREDVEHLAAQITEVTAVIEDMDLDLLKLALKDVENKKSSYDTIGIIFDPWHHESQSKAHNQAIKRMEALIAYKEALKDLREARNTHLQETVGKASLGHILGL